MIAPCGFGVDEAVRRSAHLDRERIAPNARWVVAEAGLPLVEMRATPQGVA